MAGIKRIQQSKEEGQKESRGIGNELILKDGDQAFLKFVATGNDDDERMGDAWFHTIKTPRDDGYTQFKTVLCERESGTCKLCKDEKASHQFGIWVFVYYVMHTERKSDDWTIEKTPSGTERYRENVNDFRVFRRGFGLNDYLWNQVVDIYTEEGSLNQKVVRIKRVGSGMKDTSYSLSVSGNQAKVSKELEKKEKDLPSMLDYFKQTYGSSLKEVRDVEKDDPVLVEEEEELEDLF